MGTITTYIHHGVSVSVDEKLKGKHREHCLCFRCERFKPESRTDNCRIANLLYAVCVVCDLTTPVWECPSFKEMERNPNGDDT